MKKNIVLALVALVALAAGLAVQKFIREPVENPAPVQQALDFNFPDVNDNMLAISAWRGKVLVINFWATWCAPCLQEIPEFMKLQAEYQDRGLQFVGVAIDEKQPVQAYLQKVGINYPVMVAGDAGIALSQQLGNVINAVPFTLMVNKSGQVVHRQPGELSNEQILEYVQPLLAQ
jgi:thiol-disulfide isomerase/thioredoxin